MAITNDALKFREGPFAVSHFIEDCPPFTVIRELTMNAVEAAEKIDPPGKIEWFCERIGGIDKLGLFNEGPGMSPLDLKRLTDLASSDKELGLEKNFGHGGKVAGLKVSPHGMIYRSCADGKVCQIKLAMETRPNVDYPVAVRERQLINEDGIESWETVIDVTERYRSRIDRDLSKDWTEVVLLGQSDDHDTVSELIRGQKQSPTWLARFTNLRFFRFPEGIEIKHINLPERAPNRRSAIGLEAVMKNHAERSEDVIAEHPEFGAFQIRYILLVGDSRDGTGSRGHSRCRTLAKYGIGTNGDHVCIVWRNEAYDVRTGWAQIAGSFGILYGSSNIAVHIIFPDECPFKDNTYRDSLILKRTREHVRLEDFAESVRVNRPQWLIDYIEDQHLKSTSSSGVQERLRRFLDEIQAKPDRKPKVGDDGDVSGEKSTCPDDLPGTRNEGTGRGGRSNSGNTKPETGAKRPGIATGIPDVVFTTDHGILEKMRGGRAAYYRRQDNTVFLNPNHFRYLDDLEKLYQETGPDAERRQIARAFFEEAYKFRVGCFVVQAWIFNGRSDWADDDWENALSAEVLTIHLTSPEALHEAQTKLRQKLKTGRANQ